MEVETKVVAMAEEEQTRGMAKFRETLSFLWHLEANLNGEASVRAWDWEGGLRGGEGQREGKGRTLLIWRRQQDFKVKPPHRR